MRTIWRRILGGLFNADPHRLRSAAGQVTDLNSRCPATGSITREEEGLRGLHIADLQPGRVDRLFVRIHCKLGRLQTCEVSFCRPSGPPSLQVDALELLKP